MSAPEPPRFTTDAGAVEDRPNPTATWLPPPTTKTEPAAVVTLILGLASIFLPFVAATVALFLAPGAKRNIDASDGLRTGRGLITAGVTLAILGSAVWLLVALSVLFSSNWEPS